MSEMSIEGNGVVGVPRSWTLWTVWSANLGALMDSLELSTMEFASEIIAVVQEKDSDFKYKEDEDIRVIRPTKLLDVKKEPETGAVRIEIGGTLFRPGTRNDDGGFGKRWRLIASNKLAMVFHADKKFIPVKLCNEIFVILNGRVLEPARQIWMDDYDRETKIIRLIDEQIQPGTDDRYLKVSYKFRNCWKRRGSSKHAVLQVIPYSSLLNVGSPVSEARKRSLPLVGANGEVSPEKTARNSNSSSSNDTSRSKRSSSSSKSTVIDIKGSTTEDINGDGWSKINKQANGTREGRSKKCNDEDLYRIDSFGDDDEREVVENRNDRPSATVKKRSKQVAKHSRKEKSPDRTTYWKLRELEHDLTVACSGVPEGEFAPVLKNRNAYGIVEKVLQVPKETVKRNESKVYLLRISDETKTNALVRLCTGIQGPRVLTVRSEVGPLMKAGDIIRIHRATVQFETTEGDLRELVVSTATHLNYTIFNNDTDIDAPVEFVRLAKGTEAIKDGDEDIVRNLRRFSAARTEAASRTCNSQSSADDEFYDSQSHLSSDESFKATADIEEIENELVAESPVVTADEKENETAEEEPAKDDDSELMIMIPGSESSGSSQSDAEDHRNQQKAVDSHMSDAEVDLTLTKTLSQVSLSDCESERTFALKGRIRDLMEVFDEDTIYVRITDGTTPTLNFKRLINLEENAVAEDEDCVDIAIQKVSENVSVRKIVFNQVGSSTAVVFRCLRIGEEESDDETGPSFQLMTEAKSVFAGPS